MIYNADEIYEDNLQEPVDGEDLESLAYDLLEAMADSGHEDSIEYLEAHEQ